MHYADSHEWTSIHVGALVRASTRLQSMSLEAKFRALSKRAAECQRHIGRLSVVDSLRLREEVASLVRSDLRTLENDIKSVKQLAEQEDEDTTRKQIFGRIEEYEQQCQQLQASSRTALWQSKKRLDEQEQKMRQELFGGLSKDGKSFTEQYELRQRRDRGQDEALLRASSDVTEALRRTSKLMQQELEKSAYSASMLADSSKTLHATYNEYQNFGSLLNISRRLVRQLEASDWLDRISLLVGVLFFVLVALYIIKKRTWDVGISWVSWITGKGRTTISSSATTVTSIVTATYQDVTPTSVMTPIIEQVTSITSAVIAEVSEAVTELPLAAPSISIKDEL